MEKPDLNQLSWPYSQTFKKIQPSPTVKTVMLQLLSPIHQPQYILWQLWNGSDKIHSQQHSNFKHHFLHIQNLRNVLNVPFSRVQIYGKVTHCSTNDVMCVSEKVQQEEISSYNTADSRSPTTAVSIKQCSLSSVHSLGPTQLTLTANYQCLKMGLHSSSHSNRCGSWNKNKSKYWLAS